MLAFLETPSVYAELATVGMPVRLVVGERSAVSDGRLSPTRWLKGELHRRADAVVAKRATARAKRNLRISVRPPLVFPEGLLRVARG